MHVYVINDILSIVCLPSLSLSLSLSLSHTHTHTHIHTLSLAQSLSPSLSLSGMMHEWGWVKNKCTFTLCTEVDVQWLIFLERIHSYVWLCWCFNDKRMYELDKEWLSTPSKRCAYWNNHEFKQVDCFKILTSDGDQ